MLLCRLPDRVFTLWVEDVDELDAILAPVVGNGNEVIPACNVGHVFAELLGAAVSVSVEAELLAGLRKLLEVELGTPVPGMSDAVGKEGFSIRAEEPMATVNLSQGNVLRVRCVCPKVGENRQSDY